LTFENFLSISSVGFMSSY